MKKYKTYRINEMSWTEFDSRRRETDMVIIPTGACEVYGPHLPMGSDLFAAEGVSEILAEKTGALIAPATPLADSSMLLDYPGTITIAPEVYRLWMEEVVKNLVGYGFRKLIFVTGHAANVSHLSSIACRYQREQGIRFCQIDWWRFTAAHDEGIMEMKGRMAHGHASECGTSVMLYFRPELVDMEKAERVEPPADTADYPDINYFVSLNRKTPNGIVGDATLGTAEKGKRIVERCVGRILDFLADKWGVEADREA